MRYIVTLLGALLLTGCGVDVLMATAVQGDLQARQAKSANRVLNRAKAFKGTTEIKSAINLYRAEYGSNPPSLEHLVPGHLDAVPIQSDGSAYGYDPRSGRISNRPSPNNQAAPNNTARDQKTMRTVLAAIQKYGTATRFYPRTLDDLHPRYLQALPRTVDGQEFIYNNQNGQVSLPYRPQTQPTRRAATPRRGSGMGGSGSGPMGEVMTGMGVSKELNGMRHSGVSSASSRSRQKLRTGAADQNQRIDDTLKDLGLD